jgi:hypothetical protein
VNDYWREETARVTDSFDRVADLYRREFADELDRKPFDRDLLDRVAGRFPTGLTVLEVGAGPAHVAARLDAGGFVIEERTVRPPYDDEHQTDRCYVIAASGYGA